MAASLGNSEVIPLCNALFGQESIVREQRPRCVYDFSTNDRLANSQEGALII